MASLSWIEAALPGLLPCLWICAGLGLPWAYAALPRRDWLAYPLIAALALALGPAWIGAWTLALGMAGTELDLRLLTAEWILLGSLLISLLGMALAWRRRREPAAARRAPTPLAADEKLIITLIGIAIALRWLHTAYFPFTAYDALWVYGYQGRLFFLEGLIPESVGYYPPFLSLQFASVQALIGAINDHAARMILPCLHIGGILAAYLLGARLLNRRVGLITAALWSLHPFVGQWSFRGDLEITLSFSFTLAAVFLLGAWRERHNAAIRRHEALLAGVMLGIALFTKPTAGAFIWGVLLLLAFELLRTRWDLRRFWPGLQAALWTGLACLPLGGIWYARNLLLGHDAVTLPKALWLTRALRSGDYLAPLILMAVLTVILLMLARKASRLELALGMGGLALLLAGALASNPTLFPARVDPPSSYIRPEELMMMLAGLGLAAFGLKRALCQPLSARDRQERDLAFWALLLALPYFVTFFFSYSYHFRLGFAVLPLLCLPSAIVLARILDPERIGRWRTGWRRAYLTLLAVVCLPGVVAVMTDAHWSQVWLFSEDLPGDFEKYQRFNPSLMQVVSSLGEYARSSEVEPRVYAPGEERLPFFFPRMRIHDDLLSGLDDLEALGATHIVYGAKAREAYLDAGIDPIDTQLVAALGRYDLFTKAAAHYEGVFSYELYAVSDLKQRWRLPERFAAETREAVFDNRLRLYAGGLFPLMIHEEIPITFEPTWQVLAPIPGDYEIVMQVRHASGELGWEWRLATARHRHGVYRTSLWSPGEIVNDRLIFSLPGEPELDADGFTFWLGLWDGDGERFLPLEIDGEPAGEMLRLPGVYRFVS